MPKKTFFKLDDEKKERVLRAAIQEFVDQGYEKAKIGTITQTAGIAKGSIYQYFENKKELFLYAIQWTLQFFMQTINRQTPLAEMDVFEYLLRGGKERWELIRQEPLLVRFSQDFSSGKYGHLTREINEKLDRMSDTYMLSLIQVGKEKGTVRKDVDDSILLLFYQGVTDKMNEYMLSLLEENGLALTETQFLTVQTKIKELVGLLKNGMGK